ncbi:hypothetical protein [Streptomyces sp. C184]|uniref:hypothetical protein n=1 Tax=Streptomyces sp. C184 TaxID=3237121 RepID=UPI0034C668B9
MSTATSPTDRTVAAFEAIAADVHSWQWAWEPRESFTKKAIRATKGNTICLVDIHPKVDHRDWVFGGAYLRGVDGSGTNIDDTTSLAARQAVAAHITATFAAEIADAKLHVDDGSIASRSTNWRSGGGSKEQPS